MKLKIKVFWYHQHLLYEYLIKILICFSSLSHFLQQLNVLSHTNFHYWCRYSFLHQELKWKQVQTNSLRQVRNKIFVTSHMLFSQQLLRTQIHEIFPFQELEILSIRKTFEQLFQKFTVRNHNTVSWTISYNFHKRSAINEKFVNGSTFQL